MKTLQLFAGLAISIIALYLAFHGVDFRAVVHALPRANYLWLLLSVLLICGSIVLRARRWQVLFSQSDRLHLGRLFGVLNVGYLANNLLPLRAGELIRAVLLGQVEQVGRVETLSTILVERVVDTLGVIVLIIAVMPLVHGASAAVRPILVLTALLVIWLSQCSSQPSAAPIRCDWSEANCEAPSCPVSRRYPPSCEAAITGLDSLTHPGAAAEVVALTVVVYLIMAAAMQACSSLSI